jgi:hypothetical protein
MEWVMSRCRYSLSAHVHACETSGVLIFLDLRNDQYFSLDRSTSRLLAPLLSGEREDTSLDDERQKALRCAADVLLAQKLITPDAASADKPAAVQWERPTRSLGPNHYDTLSKVRAARLLDFFAASTRAAGKLRYWPIARTVESIRAGRRERAASFDSAQASELMSAFVTLRPLFPKPYVCLFDSLAALEFLSHHHCFPKWVFAVKASPFGAHCWLQEGDLILNDSVERVGAYTPIMIV